MLFGLFKNKEIEESAKSMAERFAKRFPPELHDDTRPMVTQKRASAIQAMHSEAGELRRRVRLGVYRKAELANTLKWELKERGYRADFVNSIVYDLLIHLASAKKKR